MSKNKALLVIAGGRATPDVLALYCVQPYLVVILTSEQGWDGETAFLEIAKSLPSVDTVKIIRKVKAYDFEAAKDACRNACSLYTEDEWDWTFSISSGPKITGIAAYEVAKEKGIPCLYIDTRQEEVVSLVKNLEITPQSLFQMSISDYMKIQHRQHKQLTSEGTHYRKIVEKWGDIARFLALSLDTVPFIKMMHDKKEKIPVPFTSDTLATSILVQDLVGVNAIEINVDANRQTACAFTTKHFAHFIGTGDWLEFYVWNETKLARFADDCQWGYEIGSSATNELDVVLTYKAQLIFVECKADEEPFQGKTSYLDTINNKAEMLGRTYVTKLFITNGTKQRKGYANFLEQAKLRKIVVVTFEDLPDIGEILKREAKNPTYPRI